MKITNKINNLQIGEKLKEGQSGSHIFFEKFKPFCCSDEKHLNLQVSYLNSYIIIPHVENGITDDQLGEYLKRLKEKHLEDVNVNFNDLNRYSCGRKFDI